MTAAPSPARPADADAAAHVFVDDVDAPALTPDDRHHLERVLRLRAGALITVADGSGRWRVVRFDAPLEPASDVIVARRPSPALAVGLALVKGERPELAVQKLTELGIDRVVLFAAARSVVRWEGERVARQRDRFVAIARAAAMQSRRAFVPTIELGTPFAELAGLPGVALAERGGHPPGLGHPTILVGPEGGWSDDERRSVEAHVALGDAVLRAETAAIAAGVALAGIRAGLLAPRDGINHAG